jgi:exopolysaccharide biosynthesis polyprenyl glycosylphosphotransferase
MTNRDESFGGAVGMADPMSAAETLRPFAFAEASKVLRKSGRSRWASPYRLSLVVFDFLAASAGLLSGLILTERDPGMWLNPASWVTLPLMALMLIGFFPTYRLYSYHQVFMFRWHLASIIKSFVWGLIALGVVSLLYLSPESLTGFPSIAAVFSVALIVLFLSRFIWNYLVYVLKAVGMGFLAAGLLAKLFPNEIPVMLHQSLGLSIGWAAALSLVALGRFFAVHILFGKWLRRQFRAQVVIVGSDKEAKRITAHIIRHRAPFWVTGFIGSSDDAPSDDQVKKPLLGELRNLPKIVERERIQDVIVTDESIEKGVLISLLDYCTSQGLGVWFPPRLMPIIGMKLYIDSFCGLPMVRLCRQANEWVVSKIKNGLDALVSFPLVFALLPLFGVIAAAIRLDTEGPVFYRASAIGKGGRRFTMYKFRSMRVSNDHQIHKEYVTKLIKGEITPEGKGGEALKITNDPRVTSVGRILRKTSLDELPQLFNVLKGDMSLVGPRPCLPYEYELYEDWHRKRLSIRPGITGLWQVTGRSAVSFEDMVLLDLYYLYNRSVMMDLNILYETVFAVLAKKGAY